jgi:hypothetical protein
MLYDTSLCYCQPHASDLTTFRFKIDGESPAHSAANARELMRTHHPKEIEGLQFAGWISRALPFAQVCSPRRLS